MGRYYTGDIEGKFWVGVQASDAPSRFGGEECEPNVIEYYFDKEQHYEGLCEELDNIKENLGDWLEKLDKFFKEHDAYSDEKLIANGFPKDNIDYLVSEYADYLLGNEIKECLEKNGSCTFEAEC